jgi:hypothetical protein
MSAGLTVGSTSDLASNGEIAYTSNLKAYRNGIANIVYGCRFFQNSDRISIASNITWYTGTTDYDLSTFGLPAGIRAALIRIVAVSPAAANRFISVKPLGTSVYPLVIRAGHHTSTMMEAIAWVPTNTAGDISVYCDDVWTPGYLECFGYAI